MYFLNLDVYNTTPGHGTTLSASSLPPRCKLQPVLEPPALLSYLFKIPGTTPTQCRLICLDTSQHPRLLRLSCTRAKDYRNLQEVNQVHCQSPNPQLTLHLNQSSLQAITRGLVPCSPRLQVRPAGRVRTRACHFWESVSSLGGSLSIVPDLCGTSSCAEVTRGIWYLTRLSRLVLFAIIASLTVSPHLIDSWR